MDWGLLNYSVSAELVQRGFLQEFTQIGLIPQARIA